MVVFSRELFTVYEERDAPGRRHRFGALFDRALQCGDYFLGATNDARAT